MKLMNILEDNQDQNLVDAHDRVKKLLNDYMKGKGLYSQDYSTPEGRYEIMIHFKDGSYSSDTWGKLELRIYFSPNMENPTLPLDMLTKALNFTMQEFRTTIPELLNEPIDILNKFEIKIFDFYVKAGQSLYTITELIGVPLYNIRIRGFLEPFGELLTDQSRAELFMFAPIELPEFSENYTSIHNHIIKKAKTIVKAYRKGTWKGHTYDLGVIDDRYNSILLLTNNYNQTVVDGVIHPSLKVHLNMMSPEMDGIRRYEEGYPLSDEELKEFKEHMGKVFAKFGIKYE
jgi:hypothetical protein